MASTSPENGPGKKDAVQGRQPRAAKPERLDVPAYYAATAQVLVSGNDATVLFTTPHPAITPEGELASKPLNEPVVLIHMSLAGLKDLSAVTADMVRRIEQQGAALHSELARREHVQQAETPGASVSRH